MHALGLLAAHALHLLSMTVEHRQHVIRTGPRGEVMSGSGGMGSAIFWALLQVRCLGWCCTTVLCQRGLANSSYGCLL